LAVRQYPAGTPPVYDHSNHTTAFACQATLFRHSSLALSHSAHAAVWFNFVGPSGIGLFIGFFADFCTGFRGDFRPANARVGFGWIYLDSPCTEPFHSARVSSTAATKPGSVMDCGGKAAAATPLSPATVIHRNHQTRRFSQWPSTTAVIQRTHNLNFRSD